MSAYGAVELPLCPIWCVWLSMCLTGSLLLLYCAAALVHSVGKMETDLDAELSDDEFNCSEIPQII